MKRKPLSQRLNVLIKDIEADEEFVAPNPWERDELLYLLMEVHNELKELNNEQAIYRNAAQKP